MLNTFPNSSWIESYGQNTGTMRSLPDPQFFHDIWRSNRWISVILMPICSLARWLQLCFFTTSWNSFWIGSYDFSKVGLHRNLGFLLLAAARVYALFLLPTIQSTTSWNSQLLLPRLALFIPHRVRWAGCCALGCCACWAACCSSRLDPVDCILPPSRLPEVSAQNCFVKSSV